MSLLPALALVLSMGAAAHAKPHEPEVLAEVEIQVWESVNAGRTPVLVVDLDDTVFTTRARNMRIVREFAATPEVRALDPAIGRALRGIKGSQIRYNFDDTLKGLGITDADVLKKGVEFWLARFFSDEYCAQDPAIAGAPEYFRLLASYGAKIVYLTGRDVPRMQKGTLASLKKNGLPLEREGAVLMMKPDKKDDDLKFKKDAFARIATMGEVVGVFENEPANLNAMAEAFPQAAAVFVDTVHSAKPDVPLARAKWIGDYDSMGFDLEAVNY